MTVTIWPATVSVAVLALAPVLAAALNAATPVPFPTAPDVTGNQAALLVAVQMQPPGAVTVTEPDPPAADNAWLVAEIA